MATRKLIIAALVCCTTMISALCFSSSRSLGRYLIPSQLIKRERRRIFNDYDEYSFASRLFSSSLATSIPTNQKEKPTKRPASSLGGGARKNARIAYSNTGGLRKLPVVKPPKEIISGALKEARQINPDTDMGHIRNRARKHGAETLNKLVEELCLPLRDTVNGYKFEWKRFHPFERVVADLSARNLEKEDGLTLNLVLDEIHEARKHVREAGKDWIAKVKSAETAKLAGEAMEEGMAALTKLFEELAVGPLTKLKDIQKGLRSSPVVALDTPAVVLVGAPNVGKSSIVRHISSATPEVNNYPFTTRGMTLGHVEVFWSDNETVAQAVIHKSIKKRREESPDKEEAVPLGSRTESKDGLLGNYAFSQYCQVMDSPGLLKRPDEERNEMEALTIAAMQHLPTAVMFVMDLTGEAGDRCSSVADQLELRRQIRARFPKRPWIDVVSKYDLGIVDGALKELEEIIGSDSYIKLSVKENIGVDELKRQVMKVLGEVRVVLDAMATVDLHSLRPRSAK